jgi:FixJ family two-component response regulator
LRPDFIISNTRRQPREHRSLLRPGERNVRIEQMREPQGRGLIADEDGLDEIRRAGGDQALELICELEARNSAVPIIAFGGHPSIRQVVDAMQHGLVDVFIAPYDYAEMASAIRSAILLSMSRREASMRAHRVRHLTPREKQILAAIAHGHSNKEAAWQLGISPRTVEVHRANVMHKLAVRTLADLVRVSVDDEASDHPGHG